MFASTLIFVIVIGVAAADVFFKVRLPAQSWYAGYAELGSWLEGVLTPISVLLAGLGIVLQSKATAETNRAAIQAIEAQTLSNKLAATGIFLDKLETFFAHLDYLCFCVLLNRRPNKDELPKELGLGFRCILLALDSFSPEGIKEEVPQVKHLQMKIIMSQSTHVRALTDALDRIISLGKQVGFEDMLDGRVRVLRAMLKLFVS